LVATILRSVAAAAPIRLMVGLHYLKHAFDLIDESVVAGFVENPYWQYFCGYEYFQHEFSIDPSSLTRWRKRVGDSGIERLLEELLETAKRAGHLKSENRMSKNHLKGTEGDKINALLCGCGFNLRKLQKAFLAWWQKTPFSALTVKSNPLLAA